MVYGWCKTCAHYFGSWARFRALPNGENCEDCLRVMAVTEAAPDKKMAVTEAAPDKKVRKRAVPNIGGPPARRVSAEKLRDEELLRALLPSLKSGDNFYAEASAVLRWDISRVMFTYRRLKRQGVTKQGTKDTIREYLRNCLAPVSISQIASDTGLNYNYIYQLLSESLCEEVDCWKGRHGALFYEYKNLVTKHPQHAMIEK